MEFTRPIYSLSSVSNGQFIIGDGNNLYDFTYVENVAHAHVCAERALASPEADKAAGQVPFRSPSVLFIIGLASTINLGVGISIH